MLDIKFIRENPEKAKEGLRKKGVDFDLDHLLAVDEKRRGKIREVDDLRAEQNAASEEIAKLAGEERALRIAAMQDLKTKLTAYEFELRVLEEEFSELISQVPNLPLDDVPVGRGEAENRVLREVGSRPSFDFDPKDHMALGEALGIIDFDRAAKVSGSGFYYLKNEGVLLEFALVNYALDFLSGRGFTLCFTPDLARSRFYLGTGYVPRGDEAQIYEIKDQDLGLIATAEVALAGLHADEILDDKSLPLRYAGYSHCFRQEAGSYGKYSKGLYRLHQFTKVEMFVYARPEESEAVHRELLSAEEELWRGLGIPYRVIEMCAGDLGSQAARKFDLEAWMPGRNDGRGDWGEITSTSNTTDYQARNLNIRYRDKSGEGGFVHTLNGTAIATARAIIAILENFQQEDGAVKIPEALQKYMRGIREIRQ